MKHLICIFLLALSAHSLQAQTEETIAKLKKIEGDWHLDSKSGNPCHYKSIQTSVKSKEELFVAVKNYIPQFYQNIKMLYEEEKWTPVKMDSLSHQLIIKGRSGIVYSLFASELYTQDIFHTMTINIYSDSVTVKIEHTTFRKTTGLREPKSQDLELKQLYPINPQSEDKDFYGNSFHNLNNKMLGMLNEFERYVKSLSME